VTVEFSITSSSLSADTRVRNFWTRTQASIVVDAMRARMELRSIPVRRLSNHRKRNLSRKKPQSSESYSPECCTVPINECDGLPRVGGFERALLRLSRLWIWLRSLHVFPPKSSPLLF
jgi:hypothetical protein